MGRALALLLVLAGCGGGGNGEEASSRTDDTDTTEITEPSVTVTSAQARRVRVERPSGTPLGEVIPPGDDAYLLLSTGRCQELLARTGSWRPAGGRQVEEDAFFLYRAAAEACLGRWEDAERDYQRLLQVGPDFSGGCNSTNCEQCMRAVLEWLKEILAVRRQDTSAEVELVKGTRASPCPAPGRGTPDDEEEATTTTEEDTTTSRGRTSTSRRTSTSTTDP